MALSQPLDDHFHTNIADSTVRAAITRSRLDFIRLRKGHGLPDFGLLGALRMTTPANRLGAIRFSLLAPIPYKISHRWQQGTHTVRGHIWQLALASTCPRCSSAMPQGLKPFFSHGARYLQELLTISRLFTFKSPYSLPPASFFSSFSLFSSCILDSWMREPVTVTLWPM